MLHKLTTSDHFIKNNELLNSKFKGTKFYTTQNNYVFPRKVKLGTDVKGNETFFHYVPILNTIKAVFSNKYLAAYLDQPIQNDSNIFRDFSDGNGYKENKFFQKNPDAIKVILYQDSFEIINPIGSARTKHKIVGIYMTFGNLLDCVRTHINTISSFQLVALVTEKLFDHNKVYGEIVKDLQILERKLASK